MEKWATRAGSLSGWPKEGCNGTTNLQFDTWNAYPLRGRLSEKHPSLYCAAWRLAPFTRHSLLIAFIIGCVQYQLRCAICLHIQPQLTTKPAQCIWACARTIPNHSNCQTPPLSPTTTCHLNKPDKKKTDNACTIKTPSNISAKPHIQHATLDGWGNNVPKCVCPYSQWFEYKQLQ